jgi:hypothetical protein
MEIGDMAEILVFKPIYVLGDNYHHRIGVRGDGRFASVQALSRRTNTLMGLN